MSVTREMLVAGGAGLIALVTFQMLLGYRKIKFKGAKHWRVHRAVAWVLIAASVFHAFAALLYTHVIRF